MTTQWTPTSTSRMTMSKGPSRDAAPTSPCYEDVSTEDLEAFQAYALAAMEESGFEVDGKDSDWIQNQAVAMFGSSKGKMGKSKGKFGKGRSNSVSRIGDADFGS